MRSLNVPSLVDLASQPARPRGPLLVVLVLFALPLLIGCSQQSSSSSAGTSASDPVVARVNGTEIRESQLAMAEEELSSETDLAQLPPEAKREHILNYAIQITLLAQAGEAKHLQDTDEFKKRMAFMRSKMLMIQTLQASAKEAASDQALRQLYDEQIRPMGGAEEVRARHILFAADPKDEKALAAAEAKARAALERIKAGEDFAKLASELTDDPSGKQNGGDLDYFTKQQMVPEFANVAFQMFPGQVSNPVRTQFGYHIIKLEDRRTRPVPAFETVKDKIAVYVVRRAQSELFKQLTEKAKIERLSPPPSAAPPPGAPSSQTAPPTEATPPPEAAPPQGSPPAQGTPPAQSAPPADPAPQLEGGPVLKKQ